MSSQFFFSMNFFKKKKKGKNLNLTSESFEQNAAKVISTAKKEKSKFTKKIRQTVHFQNNFEIVPEKKAPDSKSLELKNGE